MSDSWGVFEVGSKQLASLHVDKETAEAALYRALSVSPDERVLALVRVSVVAEFSAPARPVLEAAGKGKK